MRQTGIFGKMGLVERVDLSGVRVLVVEDHLDSLDLLQFWLERVGADVKAAASGLQAIASLGRDPAPDVIVCDLHMPGMDGCAFVTELREKLGLGHVPVIALTGSASDNALLRTLEAGFQAHLIKPVTGDAVARQVQRVLKR
jgi:CheY-like chemotaxis protein